MSVTSSTFMAIGKWAIVRSLLAWWRQMTKGPHFYPDRATLDRESPLADKMQATERMYAIWFTGTKAIQEIEEVGKVERLLLPNPTSNLVRFHQSAMGESRDIGEEIRANTKRAQDKGIKVRWLSEFLGYTLTIYNPKGLDPWVNIEISFPIVHGSRHPSFDFSRSKHSATVNDIIKVFNELWESDSYSMEPNSDGRADGTR